MEVFCPAKVNLLLAVTGRRSDGYHELVSLMAPLDVGDTLHLEAAAAGERHFTCSESTLPMDASNLVVRAVTLFEESFPLSRGFRLHLEKRVPMGAGLGGGSSNAAGTLLLLNRFAGKPASSERLDDMAAQLGSDCPFFLRRKAMIARGRGERLETAPQTVQERLRGLRIFLLKPSFSVSTVWAYRRMAARVGDYIARNEAEERLARWIDSPESLSQLLFNNMEPAVFEKFVALPVMRQQVRELGVQVVMSGSGSTLFVPGNDKSREAEIRKLALEAWGESAWLAPARIEITE